MAEEHDQEKKNEDFGGQVLAGCVVTGVGAGFLSGNLIGGTLVGVGIGLIAMALIKYRSKSK